MTAWAKRRFRFKNLIRFNTVRGPCRGICFSGAWRCCPKVTYQTQGHKATAHRLPKMAQAVGIRRAVRSLHGTTHTSNVANQAEKGSVIVKPDEAASKKEQRNMADPFEVRMRFTNQLRQLNASVTSAQKAAQYALKYKDMDEDLHSCILEQLERVWLLWESPEAEEAGYLI